MDSYTAGLRDSDDPSVAYRARRRLDGLRTDESQLRWRQRVAATSSVQRLLSHRQPDGTIRLDIVVSRGTFADWGPTGRSRANPYVSIDAAWVLTRCPGSTGQPAR